MWLLRYLKSKYRDFGEIWWWPARWGGPLAGEIRYNSIQISPSPWDRVGKDKLSKKRYK